MPFGPAAQSALLKWINTFPLDFKVESLADLSDGVVLSKALADIDSSYTPRVLPKSDALQALVNALFRYIRMECENLDPLLDTPGLKTIAEHGKAAHVFEVLTVLLMAAISGPDRATYVRAITKLDPGVQSQIADVIKQKQREIENVSTKPSNGQQDLGAPSINDLELQFEVRYSTLISQKKNLEQEKDRLKKQMADLTTRLERLQDNNDLLQERLTAAEDGLRGAAKDEDTTGVIKNLEAKIREQDELIANQEGQVEQDRIEKTRMRKDIDRLTSTSDRIVQLQDEIKELQYQNLELTKKANTVDRFKQKLESQRDFQTENKQLEFENEELKLRCRDFELLKHRNETLEATHVQFQNTLGKREMEIFELSSQKKILDEEKADLQRAIARLEALKSAGEDHINELQEQLVSKSHSVVSPVGTSVGNLEEELEQSTQTDTRTNLEISRLRTENQLLKGNAAAVQDAAELRIKLEEAERIRSREEAKYNELFEKHVIAKQQVSAILDASTAEGLVKGVNAALLIGQLEVLTLEYYSSEAFSNLRKSYLSTTEKLAVAERRIRELEADLEETKRELLTANTDLSMVAKEDIEALEELKATQEALAFSFENELQKLRSRHKDLEVDYEQQKSQLIEALLSKDKLQQSMNENYSRVGGKVGSISETSEENEKKMKDKLDKAGADMKKNDEHIKKQDNIIHELQTRIKDLETHGHDGHKSALEQENTNLRRENALISTAWYDLTQRLQSNHVVLQRRRDAPRSWINKQRQAVNAFGK